MKQILLAIAVFMTATAVHAETTTLKFATFLPAQTPFVTQALEPWIADVEAASEGMVKIDLYAGASLVRHPDKYFDAVRAGIAEIGFIVGAYTPGQFPDERLLELPMSADDPYQGSVSMWRLYEQGMTRGYEELKVLGFLTNGPNALLLTEPVGELADVSGKKLRVSGSAQTDIVSALSGVPISNVPATQAAEGMSRGLVDGTLSTWTAAAAFRTDKVAKQAIEYPLGYTVIMIAMNKAAWEQLPEVAKSAFDQHSGEAFSARMGTVETKLNSGMRSRFAADGEREIRTLDDAEREEWNALFQPVIDTWLDQTDGARERYEALQSIRKEVGTEKGAE